MLEPQFKTQQVATAKEFIDLLRLTDSRWSSGREWSSCWYFRGQSDSHLNLVPSAWRRATDDARKTEAETIVEQRRKALEPGIDSFVESLHRRGEHIENMPTRDILLQAYTEFSLIREFIELADSLGFQTPGAAEFPDNENTFVWRYYDSLLQHPENLDFHTHVWRNSAVALAQHHGIPTRLLDWSRKPLYAAFFAAERASESPDDNPEIAVYALHGASLGRNVELVTVPRSENSYLHAQDGVFTLLTGGDDYFYGDSSWPRLEVLPELYDVEAAQYPCKFTLPVGQVAELLRLLSLENVSRAHLMPSFDNVVRTLKTKWQWTSSSRL
ncbi:MAG: FRG domain-containing protein [Chloroflexi bacterium]|nr:FRG domain-containing protein [Chloroflexota bacterium]